VVYKKGSDISADDVRDADVLIVRTRTHCCRKLLEGSSVRLVVTATIGFDHIDTAYLAEAGIKWTNCPGCNASSVCQYVHNSLLALDMLRPGLTVGVVGVGHVGSLVAADLERAGLRVLRCDPPLAESGAEGEFVSLADVAAEADIITFHTPLTRGGAHPTYHMGDEAFFASLKRTPLIINSGRGEVVGNKALLRALEDGVVRDAVIDTWEGEPDLDLGLLRRAVIATPHIAGYSADGKANATRMSLQAVCDFYGLPFAVDVSAPDLPEDKRPTSDDPAVRALQLYNPMEDTERLKRSPEKFEWLRGNYPLRREL
jgi:erythronate-4-phosphate dehydrogenase